MLSVNKCYGIFRLSNNCIKSAKLEGMWLHSSSNISAENCVRTFQILRQKFFALCVIRCTLKLEQKSFLE